MNTYPYEYDDMLIRLFNSKSEEDAYKKINLPVIDVSRKNKTSIISNFHLYIDKLNRTADQISNYFREEGRVNVSVNSRKQLIIQGNFDNRKCETIMTNYIKEYVMCKQCKSIDSCLIKDTGITFLQCHQCGAKSSLGKKN